MLNFVLIFAALLALAVSYVHPLPERQHGSGAGPAHAVVASSASTLESM